MLREVAMKDGPTFGVLQCGGGAIFLGFIEKICLKSLIVFACLK